MPDTTVLAFPVAAARGDASTASVRALERALRKIAALEPGEDDFDTLLAFGEAQSIARQMLGDLELTH